MFRSGSRRKLRHAPIPVFTVDTPDDSQGISTTLVATSGLVVAFLLLATVRPIRFASNQNETAGRTSQLLAHTRYIPYAVKFTDVHGNAQESNPVPIEGGPLPPELEAVRIAGLAVRGPFVEFADEFSFPPHLKGVTDSPGVELVIRPGPHPPMREVRMRMREASIAHADVRAALGSRFSLLRSGWIHGDKNAPNEGNEDYELVFYNYLANQTVVVTMTRLLSLKSVSTMRGGQSPAESVEEVEAAIAIVRGDIRYGALVEGLSGRGILTPGVDLDRYIYLLFYPRPGAPAVIEATVNMSKGIVAELHTAP